ncbi:lysophospholipid acyltransferase family protein [Sphingomonas sp. BIUV-7]|uniref:Lysophospholipid acyltransferase family protein n=1 Tax=Sphingomonas natans TaxID=3063330 RepID=A0ABT8YG17_9SPHN|nr:lysophospholipid acyltransferase family protein [Sphingomonas sp. BIUV-7]MDO6416745.1 lysophospholipid acyltransferase family protein [Sphingomonas sp. BIUV-7]
MTLRAYARLAAAAFWLAGCFVCYSIARPIGRESRWVRRFMRGIGGLLGLRVTIEGRPKPGHVLYVANHISWLDILALGGASEARFIAKDEIARWPLVGSLARLGGTVFVSRERRGATRVQADAVAAALGEGRPVALFAEGGTGDPSFVRPFRPALFASAVEAGTPVQPVAIDYGPDRARYAWPDGMSFADEAKRMLNRAEPVPVTLRFLPPLDPATLDRKALAAQSHAGISSALV